MAAAVAVNLNHIADTDCDDLPVWFLHHAFFQFVPDHTDQDLRLTRQHLRPVTPPLAFASFRSLMPDFRHSGLPVLVIGAELNRFFPVNA